MTTLRLGLFTTTLLAATLLPMLSSPLPTRAVTDCSPNNIVYSGSSWYSGAGVNVCSTGDDSNNYVNNIHGVSTLSGMKWECVELVNRFYLTQGWITANWLGNGNTLVDHVPSGLKTEYQNHISYLNPGDVITLDDGGSGHAAIINTTGSSIQTINQNTLSVTATTSVVGGSLSAGNAALSSWLPGYSIQAVIHHPSGGTSPIQKDVAWFQGSTLWTFTGSDLHVSGSSGFYAGAWNGVGDYNKDGHDDLFLYNSSTDDIDWMSSNGTTLGANGIGTVRTGMGGPPDWAAVGDFDGDGYRNDIVWFKGNTLYTFEEGTTGGLVQTGAVTGFHAPTWGGVGDYNHDGKDDLILYDGPTDTLYWMSSNGAAVGANGLGTIRTSIGGGPDWAAVGNFTGDGYRDSVAYFRGATLYTFTGTGLAWTGTANFYAPTWGGVSDHDGDGKDDLILYNGSTMSLYWLSSNGTAIGTNGLGFIRGADIGTPTWAGVGRFVY